MPSVSLDLQAHPPALRCCAVVPAGGTGARIGAAVPKQYLDLAGQPMLRRTVQALLVAPWIDDVTVVVAADDREAGYALAGLERVRVLPRGGATRRDSVLAGVQSLDGLADSDWVLVHDAARPGLDEDSLQRLADALRDDPVGGLLALPVADTVKRSGSRSGHSDASPRVADTLSRDGLWLAQTPQMFRFGLLRDALQRFADVTDEAAAIEQAGHAPRLVRGDRGNFKVTDTDDLRAMRERFGGAAQADGQSAGGIRIGQGWDVHALVPGRPLVIGGVTIPHRLGLLGHSDADVLLHAITDALLGGAALGDIGSHFPDTDPRFAGADSGVLLREAAARVRASGWQPINVDATIVAQTPRMGPHIAAMRERIAQHCGIDVGSVSVKAKTSERLGFAGRGEGISADAVVLLAAVPTAR